MIMMIATRSASSVQKLATSSHELCISVHLDAHHSESQQHAPSHLRDLLKSGGQKNLVRVQLSFVTPDSDPQALAQCQAE
jgi:hypothetical protein